MSAPTQTFPDSLAGLGRVVATASLDSGPADLRASHDAAVRASLLCMGLGALCERELSPAPPHLAFAAAPGGEGDAFAAMRRAFYLGTLGGAADLDAMDGGPAHLALPASAAAFVAADAFGDGMDEISDAVFAGSEAAARLRRCVRDVRPGRGFHSAGTFGLMAAAGAAARAMRLSAEQSADAVAIGLTRAAGLAANSAATRIGLTHFGWAAAHGVEAAWLSSRGLHASQRADDALRLLAPSGAQDPEPLLAPPEQVYASPVYFKWFPCNIYLNPVVLALREVGAALDRVIVSIPVVRHLDQPSPADVRQARNSAQGVTGAVLLREPRYRAFTTAGMGIGTPELTDAMGRVEVVLDEGRPSALSAATIGVQGYRGGTEVVNRATAVGELTAWGSEHAEWLAEGVGPAGWTHALYDDDAAAAYRAVVELLTEHTEEMS